MEEHDRSTRAIELQRADEADPAGACVAGKRGDSNCNRSVRRQPAAETQDMKRRVDAHKGSDVAAGVVHELFDHAHSRHRQPDVGRSLRIDIDERVEIEGRATAGPRELGLRVQDFDRRQYRGGGQHRSRRHGARAAGARVGRHDRICTEQRTRAEQDARGIAEIISGQGILGDEGLRRGPRDEHSERIRRGPVVLPRNSRSFAL